MVVAVETAAIEVVGIAAGVVEVEEQLGVVGLHIDHPVVTVPAVDT